MKDVMLKADGLYLTNQSTNEIMRISPVELWFILDAACNGVEGDIKDARKRRYEVLMNTLDSTEWSRNYERKYT